MVELKLFPDPFKIIAVDDDPAIALHFFHQPADYFTGRVQITRYFLVC
jgi:hypothetical protein